MGKCGFSDGLGIENPTDRHEALSRLLASSVGKSGFLNGELWVHSGPWVYSGGKVGSSMGRSGFTVGLGNENPTDRHETLSSLYGEIWVHSGPWFHSGGKVGSYMGKFGFTDGHGNENPIGRHETSSRRLVSSAGKLEFINGEIWVYISAWQ